MNTQKVKAWAAVTENGTIHYLEIGDKVSSKLLAYAAKNFLFPVKATVTITKPKILV